MSMSFVRAGWITFYEDNHLKRIYGRIYGSNDEITKILYGDDDIKVIKNEHIVNKEEDILAPDFSDRLGHKIKIID